jgi:tetratricopeptide (TPR) repeat protein
MNTIQRVVVLVLGLATASTPTSTQTKEQAELLKNWSLFSEYQRNGDCLSAVPYGWLVFKADPTRFKTLYQKLADCYFAFYDKATGSNKQLFADTLLMIYDAGIQHVPERAATYLLQKAYALENYYAKRDLEAIAAYEKALELDFKGIDFAYIDRLGLLYKNNSEANPAFKEKALRLYQRVLDNDPTNQTAVERMRSLVSDPKELVAVYDKLLASDPENIEYLWNAARASLLAEQYGTAERHLLKLIKKVPNNPTYWNELAKTQQRQRKFKEAIDSYERALKLNSALKENFLNISICYREMKNYTQARTYAQRAAASDKGWGRPYIEIAEIYKAAVEACVTETKGGDWSKLDINDKLVYKLAQELYARAKQVEPGIANEATQLSNALSTLVPTNEDYFFYRSNIQNGKMAIQGKCYDWIKELVTVPTR